MFDIDKVNFYKTINQFTKDYYRYVSQSENKKFMIYQFVPHILYKGLIDDTDGLEIVEINKDFEKVAENTNAVKDDLRRDALAP